MLFIKGKTRLGHVVPLLFMLALLISALTIILGCRCNAKVLNDENREVIFIKNERAIIFLREKAFESYFGKKWSEKHIFYSYHGWRDTKIGYGRYIDGPMYPLCSSNPVISIASKDLKSHNVYTFTFYSQEDELLILVEFKAPDLALTVKMHHEIPRNNFRVLSSGALFNEGRSVKLPLNTKHSGFVSP